jgi:hypothetical protein
MLSTHLHVGLPSGLFPSGVPINNLYAPLVLGLRMERRLLVMEGSCEYIAEDKRQGVVL